MDSAGFDDAVLGEVVDHRPAVRAALSADFISTAVWKRRDRSGAQARTLIDIGCRRVILWALLPRPLDRSS